MRLKTLQWYGDTVIFSDHYTASTDIGIHHNPKGRTTKLPYAATTSEPIRYFFPKQRSVDALPSDHDAWHKFDLLMEKLDSLDNVDDDLDDNWISELRSGSSSHLDEYDD